MSTFRYPQKKDRSTKPLSAYIRYDEPFRLRLRVAMADVPQKEIPRLRYPEELSKESFERDFAAKSEPVTRIFFTFG